MRRTWPPRTLPSIWPLLALLAVILTAAGGLVVLLITGAGR